ncbi:uncharacterized protein PRCAT00003318001 [Priceomyces carsonii]|uniref:uncharacterized protein n=1 Tax=Priceomyces carsonii TaxID=28549 RepID=UPI002ED78B52|nr:unnamed protein product [Priceomyces carsonii]
MSSIFSSHYSSILISQNMAFSFGFTTEALSDDELNEYQEVEQSNTREKRSALEAFSENIPVDYLPKLQPLGEILKSLEGVRLSYDRYDTPAGHNSIFKRDLFDVKHQVMCEEERTRSVSSDVLLQESRESDLKKNYYEGGFKIWECSYDMIDRLEDFYESGKLSQYSTYLELGCGTALPTCFLLKKKLESNSKVPTKFILSDFNYEVLRLVTLPNLILQWMSSIPREKLITLSSSEDGPSLESGEVLLSKRVLQEFQRTLEFNCISLTFVSGSWGTQFNKLVENFGVDFIVTSETIYSMESLPVVAESIVHILDQSNSEHSCCLVASKNIYFGVGGSVMDFISYIKERISPGYELSVEEVPSSQVKRSIIKLERV